MLRYMNFLWATLFKRKFVYILNGIFAVVILGLMYLNKLAAEDVAPNQAIKTFTNHPNSFVAFLAFIFAIIFMALVVIHVFKKQESEGTELLITAKPISRGNIIGGKMLIVLISLLGISLYAFMLFFIGAQFDSVASTTQKLEFGLGISLGVLIIGLLFTSLILICGTVVGKTGIMVITILGPVGLFIFNVSAVPILGAIAPNQRQMNQAVASVNTYKKSDGTLGVDKIYDVDDASQLKANNESLYSTVKYFDLWGQWGQAFMMLQPIKEMTMDTVGFYNTAHIELENLSSDPDRVTIVNVMVQGTLEKYYFMNDVSYEDNDNNVVITDEIYTAIVNETNKAITNKSITSKGSAYKDVNAFYDVIKNNAIIKKFIDDNYMNTVKSLVIPVIAHTIYDDNSGWSYSPYDANASNEYLLSSKQYFDSNYKLVSGTKPWLDPKLFATIWALVALGLISWAYFIYLRRDFK